MHFCVTKNDTYTQRLTTDLDHHSVEYSSCVYTEPHVHTFDRGDANLVHAAVLPVQ